MDPLKRLRVESRREPKGWPLKLLEQSQRRKLPARSARKISAPKKKWWRRENNAWNGEISDSYISDMSNNYIRLTFLLL